MDMVRDGVGLGNADMVLYIQVARERRLRCSTYLEQNVPKAHLQYHPRLTFSPYDGLHQQYNIRHINYILPVPIINP